MFCSTFKSAHFLAAFPWLVEVQHELLAHIVERISRSLLVESSKRFCFAIASKLVALPTASNSCERSLSLWGLCASPFDENGP